MTFMSNAAGRERDQFGTRMSAGLDWSLGRMPLPFSICGERHALWQKSAMQSPELVVSGYYISPRATSEHVMSPSIHVVMTKWAWCALRCQRKAKPPF